MNDTPYIPTDDEAQLLLDSVETEHDVARKSKMTDLLGRYATAKRAAGLEPFQPDPAAKQAQVAKVSALYDGLDKVDSQMEPADKAAFQAVLNSATDPEEAKARMVNQSWVVTHRPDLSGQVDADWGTVRRAVAKDVLGRDGDISDLGLYAGVAGHLKAQQARVDAANDMLGKVQEAAFNGEQDWLTAYRAAAGALETGKGVPAAERDEFRQRAQQVFAHAAARTQQLRPLADRLLGTLSRDTNARNGFDGAEGFSRAELIPTIAELPAADRMLLYRMVATQAKAGVETDAATKGAVQKVGEKFGRQIRDIALDQIASLDQSNLGGLIGFQKRLQTGEPGMIDPNTGVVVPVGEPSAAAYMAKGGYRKATPEETKAFVEDVGRKQAEYQTALELKDIAENVVDPAKFDSRIGDAIANAPGQLGYTAQAMIPGIGLPLLINSTKAMRTRELMQRGVPMDRAAQIATASAVVEAPIEWVQSKMLFGKLPGMGEALTKPLTTDSLAALASRTGKLFAAEFALQNLQEGAQDATPLVMQEITSHWDAAVPKTTKADWMDFADSRIDTAFTLLPITLIGTGVAAFKDGAYGREYMQNVDVLKATGFTEEAARQIMAEPTLAGMQDKAKDLWNDKAARKVGTPEQQQAAAAIDAQHEAAVQSTTDHAAERNSDGTFTVRDEAGQVVDTAATPEEAAALQQHQTESATPAQPAPESAVSGFEASNDVEASPLGMRMPNAASVSFTPSTDERTNAPAVINSLAQIMESIGEPGTALNRVGRMGRMGKKALGFYQVREQITRIRTANDVGTAAHEMAHALEDALFGKGNVWQNNKAVPAPARAELLQLGKDLYGPRNPVGGYHSEGFAEFNRLYLTDPAQAKAKAPEFTKTWEQELAKRPALQQAVQNAQQLATTWFQQGSKARAEQGIAAQPTRLQQFKDFVADQRGKFYRNFYEQAAPIEDFVKEAAARLGKEIPADMDPMLTLSARRLTADSVVEYMANKGMLDFAGNVTGKPLVEAFQLVQGHEQDFLLYLWAKRAEALWTDPNGPRNPGLDRADAEHLIDQQETPQFRQAADIVYKWNDGVLDYAAQASPDFAETVKKIREADPGYYIPLHREFEAFDERVRGAGGVKGKNLVAKLKGSGRRIKDPVESMLTHAKAIVLKAQQKRVLDQIIRLSEAIPGLGHYVVEVPPDQVPAASASLVSVLEKAQKALQDVGGDLKVTGVRNMAANGVDLNNEVLTFFAPATQPKQGENPVLPVYRNGKVHWYEMDGELYSALSGMDTYRLPKALDLFFGLPARTLRLGTTGLRAAFSLVTNPIRDFRTLHLNSRASANSAQLFFDWMGMMRVAGVEAITNGKAHNAWTDLAERLGVEMAQPLGQDSKPLERAARRLKRGGEWRAWDPRDQYDFVVGLLQFTETASRLTEIKNVAEDMGWDPSQPLTPEIAAKLTQAGKQVTTDFTQAGSIARAVNQAVPFFNAAIQGPAAHVKAIKRDPAKFAVRGLMLTALALANWWRNKDEEWWNEMPLQERYGYTYLPVGDELLRIPRSFEADGLFMAGAEALADAWHQRNPKEAAAWFGKWLGGFMPDVLPVPVKATAEELANKDFFSGNKIVPESQKDLPAEEQYGTYTSRVAIKLGDIFGVSPRRVDHVIRSIFGGVGGDLAGLLGRGNNDLVKPDRELSDLPVAGVLFQRGGQHARNPESVDKLYDLYGEALQRQRSRFQQEDFKTQQARLMLTDAVQAVSILEDVKIITANKDARLQLEAEQVAVARDVVKAVESGAIDRTLSLGAKGRANQRQFDKVKELGLQFTPKDKRPVRTFATTPSSDAAP